MSCCYPSLCQSKGSRMAKSEKDPLKKLSALTGKALQRGEKLERTLTKLVAQSEPGSGIENFLKAVQGGLKAIRKSAKPARPSTANGKASEKAKTSKTKALEKPGKQSEKKARRPKAASKKPVAADIRPFPEASGKE